jgi:hypothetical protein
MDPHSGTPLSRYVGSRSKASAKPPTNRVDPERRSVQDADDSVRERHHPRRVNVLAEKLRHERMSVLRSRPLRGWQSHLPRSLSRPTPRCRDTSQSLRRLLSLRPSLCHARPVDPHERDGKELCVLCNKQTRGSVRGQAGVGGRQPWGTNKMQIYTDVSRARARRCADRRARATHQSDRARRASRMRIRRARTPSRCGNARQHRPERTRSAEGGLDHLGGSSIKVSTRSEHRTRLLHSPCSGAPSRHLAGPQNSRAGPARRASAAGKARDLKRKPP